MMSHSHGKILVVDDDPIFRMMLRQFLLKNEYEVIEADNGHEAVQMFEQESPDIVLMDAVMPIMDGMAACRHICDSNKGEGSAVLMVTSKGDDAFVTAAFAAGAADYITKPIQWAVLKQRIKHRLKERSALRALQASEERFRALFHESPLPYQSLNVDGHIIEVNKAWVDMTGYKMDQVINRFFTDFLYPEEKERFLINFAKFKEVGYQSSIHYKMLSHEQKVIDVEVNGRIGTNLEGKFNQTHDILQDITSRKELEEELIKLATTDPLTGLKNRRAFFEAGERLRLHCLRYRHAFVVMMLDIDHFKAINDGFGHDVGDDVLIHVSECMQQSLREVDVLARFGGEEFAMILPETDLEPAVEVAERIRKSLAALKIETAKGLVSVRISIGVTALSTEEESLSEMLKQADALLYQAKVNGRNRVEYHQ